MLSSFSCLSSFFLASSHTPKRQPTHSHYTHRIQLAKAPSLISYCPASSVISGQPFFAGVVGVLTSRLKRLAENKEMCQKGTLQLFSAHQQLIGGWQRQIWKELAVEYEPSKNVN